MIIGRIADYPNGYTGSEVSNLTRISPWFGSQGWLRLPRFAPSDVCCVDECRIKPNSIRRAVSWRGRYFSPPRISRSLHESSPKPCLSFTMPAATAVCLMFRMHELKSLTRATTRWSSAETPVRNAVCMSRRFEAA